MADALELRLLTGPEMALVQEVWRAAGLEFHPQGRDTLERMSSEATSGTSFFVGAFKEGEMVGVALGTQDGRKGWVNRVAVLPNRRREGVAASLLAFCEAEFARRGMGLVCALIEEGNDPSMAVFQREGYVLRKDIFYFRKGLKGEDW